MLDVATGTGKLACRLVADNQAKVIGIDFCSDMLCKAKPRMASSGGDLATAMAEFLPFQDSTFDCAIIGFTLRNVTDLEKTLAEMNRVVKKGGRVISLEFSPPPHNLFGAAYRVYLSTLLPLIGRLMSGSDDAYTYLPQSIKDFRCPKELKRIMEGVGLDDVQFYRLTLGVVVVHVGTKTQAGNII